jgi:RNA polymerase sigma-70 factor (ECF subfamily)
LLETWPLIYLIKRKKDPIRPIKDEIYDDKPLLLDVIISNEEIEKLQNLLATLDPKYADVVLLKYYNDYSHADIAKFLGISRETVWTRLHRAKKILALNLIEGDPIDEKARIK